MGQFLAHLEEERDCAVQTRNRRLTAIRSFACFVASRDPVHLAWCVRIRAITTKKATPQPVSWMAKDEMEALLAVPDRQTPSANLSRSTPCVLPLPSTCWNPALMCALSRLLLDSTLSTTARYLRLAPSKVCATASPLDYLPASLRPDGEDGKNGHCPTPVLDFTIIFDFQK